MLKIIDDIVHIDICNSNEAQKNFVIKIAKTETIQGL